MKKQSTKKCRKKHVTKGTLAAIVTFTMVLQLCFSFTSLAYIDYDYNYNGWYEDGPKLKSVTGTYDDGTKYTAEYGYNDKGQKISEKIKEPDGSKSTMKKTYDGDKLVSEYNYEYLADSKQENTSTLEYGDQGYPTHSVKTSKYSDGTTAKSEVWYQNRDDILKSVDTDRDGTVEQTDYTYNDQGQPLTCVTTSTDGSERQEEWQYGESGDLTQYKSYDYDPDLHIKTTRTIQQEGEGDSQTRYRLITWETDDDDGGIYKEESWSRGQDGKPVKSVTTYPDGSQSTEEYTYGLDGKETLYTRTGSDGSTARRETTYTKSGEQVAMSDSDGNSSRSTTSYDQISGLTTKEDTRTYSDGSSEYRKTVTSNYRMVSYISRDKSADGTETYTELSEDADGNTTKKEKTADGTVTVTKTNPSGEVESISTTMPDGSTTLTTSTIQEDGNVASTVTRYSDGTEDRTDYEYDQDGDVVKSTETRRNGVSAVTVTEYTDEDGSTGSQTTTFNNGYELSALGEEPDNKTQVLTITYSAGDVKQDILTVTNDVVLNVKTVYRDGRTEEASLDLNSDQDYLPFFDKIQLIQDHYKNFLDEAWTVLPSQTENVPEATPSDAV